MTAGTDGAALDRGTTTCRAWAVERSDGIVLGFTDHDESFAFEGITFAAEAGLTARALEQTTGLAVDNSETSGALSHHSITEADVRAGLFDGAEVRIWKIDWRNLEARHLVFRGNLGEIERQGDSFRAELRGLTERLNRPVGRVYQRPCAAVLGDGLCGVDTMGALGCEAYVDEIEEGAGLILSGVGAFPQGWFARGRVTVLTGAGAGTTGVARRDRDVAGRRRVDLWDVLSPGLAPGDRIRLEPGCDKRLETCREKFANVSNFRGFPDIPGEDWLTAYPVRAGENDGGSRR